MNEELRATRIYGTAREWYIAARTDAGNTIYIILEFSKIFSGSRAIYVVGPRGPRWNKYYAECNICGAMMDNRNELTRRHIEYHLHDTRFMFARDFEFRRHADTMESERLNRLLEWREALRWAVDYLGEEWPPPPKRVVDVSLIAHPVDTPVLRVRFEDDDMFSLWPIGAKSVELFWKAYKNGEHLDEWDALTALNRAQEELRERGHRWDLTYSQPRAPKGAKEWRPGGFRLPPWLEEG